MKATSVTMLTIANTLMQSSICGSLIRIMIPKAKGIKIRRKGAFSSGIEYVFIDWFMGNQTSSALGIA